MYKKTNDQLILELYEKFLIDFKPLINKYSRNINKNFSEDLKQDLNLEVLKVITKIVNKNIEFKTYNHFISYILKSLKYKYIQFSKECSYQNTKIPYDFINSYSDKSISDNLLFFDIIKSLSKYEQQILIYLYIYNLKVTEIAKIYHVSKQNINQIKLRSLKKLKLTL